MDLNLNKSWSIQSSARIAEDGDHLSTLAADTSDWYRADLPATVLGALVDSGEFEDPFFGMNLLKIPGQGPKAENFSNHPMPDNSPFRDAWWFRKEFRVPKSNGPYIRLQLDGINYRANIWLNGERIADATRIAGAYRVFELDVTTRIDRDGANVLAIEVFPPEPCDTATSCVDWNPSPPDKNMGLWRDVWLRSSGKVAVRAPHVVSEVNGSESARLVIGGDLLNTTDAPQTAVVKTDVDGHNFEQRVELAPGELRRFEELLYLDAPRLWWPRFLGDPELYTLAVEVLVDGVISDAACLEFGVRQVTTELTEEGHALFRVNGHPVLIRGAGWATDLFLRRQPERDLAQLEYVKAMNLNTVRFEGMLERREFLDWCDREGIMVIAGWCCCDYWEEWDDWTDENRHIAAESLRSQIRRTRRHPSLISWWYGSDFSPPPQVEQRYLDILDEEHWPNARHSSAADKPTELTGSSGMKMEGPYDYVPPGYWLADSERGGAFGFATEISPGPAVPPFESLCKMLPEDHLWPIDEVWDFHAGGQEFHNVQAFANALEARYGAVDGARQFADLSQLMTYETERAMFEAYARNKFRATGVIQWMLGNAWPSLIWHLYDYYLRPGGGFFGTKKACEPLHVMYAYDDASVVVVNDFPHAFRRLGIHTRVFDLDLNERFRRSAVVDVAANGTHSVIKIPNMNQASPVNFVDLRMTTEEGNLVSRNFYWIPTRLDVLDWGKASWINTPIAEYADLRAVGDLPTTWLGAVAVSETCEDGIAVRVELANPTDKLAFFVQLRLVDGLGDDILPVLWSDNYVSLLPGETFTLRVVAPGAGIARDDLYLHVQGLNVSPRRLQIA